MNVACTSCYFSLTLPVNIEAYSEVLTDNLPELRGGSAPITSTTSSSSACSMR